ncbi:MAG: PEGA domain-containing protein [Deltaproteobacteria bacterium]|nr:PEGA domain-containing protein [Deltaproteobacteria bacterium]
MSARALLPALALLCGCPTGRTSAPAPQAPRSPTAREVRVESTPAGALAAAPGSPPCTTPCSLWLEPGRHRVAVRKTGHLPFELEVEVGPDGAPQVSAALVSSH